MAEVPPWRIGVMPVADVGVGMVFPWDLRGGMRVLVWQWGRRGAGPRFAASLADGLRLVPGTEALLSLSSSAEILQGPEPPRCQLPVATYSGAMGLAWRMAQAPLLVNRLAAQLAELRLDVAICAMPGPLDLLLVAGLRRIGTPAVVVVHDADAHPGDNMPSLMFLQRRLTRRADMVVALSEHVATRLRAQRLVDPASAGCRIASAVHAGSDASADGAWRCTAAALFRSTAAIQGARSVGVRDPSARRAAGL